MVRRQLRRDDDEVRGWLGLVLAILGLGGAAASFIVADAEPVGPHRAFLPQLASDEPRPYTPTPTATATPTALPGAPSVVSITSPIKRGLDATIAIRTTPGASCSISYRTPAGTLSQASGLFQKTADSGGNASWTWTIGGSTNPGTGSVTVTCNGLSVTTPIVITTA